MESDDSDSITPAHRNSSSTIKIRQGCKRIAKCRYENFDQARFVKIPDSVERIFDYAFKGCSSLRTVYLPEGLLTIGFGCFQECTNLTMLHIPNSVYKIKEEAFKGCASLCAVILPAQLQRIPDRCFFQCSKLQLVVIPPRVRKIGMHAFYGCSNLKQVNFPSNDLIIERNCFDDCSRLERIDLCSYGTHLDEDISIPYWGEEIFYSCYSLVEIDLSHYPVHTFKESCFKSCNGLEKVILSTETRELMNDCFSNCSSLKQIGYGSFSDIEDNPEDKFGVDLDGIDGFSSMVFGGCSNLESVIVHNQFIMSRAFLGCHKLKKISLPGDINSWDNEDIYGNKICDFFDSDNVDKLIVRSNLENISYYMVYYVMYKIILRNPGLCAKSCTPTGLHPIELAIGKLGVINRRKGNRKKDRPDELWIYNVIYHYLRNAPWMIFKMKCFH